MPPHITTAEAKRQGLFGADVYRHSHLLYKDDLHRDWGVVWLNLEALKAFADTVTIIQRHKILSQRAAVKDWQDRGGFQSDLTFPWGEATAALMEYMNYENLKIASGFELHLKARLLARDFILHEINSKIRGYRALAKEQSDRPIAKHELIAIQPYHFDGHQNYLPGLTQTSIKFSRITNKPKYRAALGLTTQQLDIINDYRLLRNQIHFPGDHLESPNIRGYPRPIIEFLTGFINTEIVDWSNQLIAKHKFNFQPFVPFN